MLYGCKQSACCHRTIHNNLYKEHHRKPYSRGCSLKTGFRYVQEVMFTSFELRLIFLCLSNRSMKVNYQISCRCSFVRKCYEWSWQSEHQENCGNLTYWNYIMPVLAKKLLADLIIIIIIIIFIVIVIISSSLLLLLSSSLFLLWVFLILLPTFLSREGGNNWYFYPLKK